MTNREKLNSMTDEDFADWICHQLWDDYGQDSMIDMFRYNTVRNFLKAEYEEDTK